ncbi:dienelactone hydrolase family protein [Metaplanococcus flavidus]
MLAIKHGNRALVLVLHEIYGINDHMELAAASFAEQGFDVLVPDLIGRNPPFSYDQSERAYRNFMDAVGFDSAFEQVKKLLAEEAKDYDEIHIVGFSVGATVAWLCSQLDHIDSVTAFYGSRIRDYRKITPLCPVLLIYGEREKSFNVADFIAEVADGSIEAVSLPGEHGFADPFAPVFDKNSRQKAMDLMENFQKTHSTISN